ncbi:glucose dehydrogenase [FAD, quinone]-like [Daktulosphaira vitifoliae]|uniref:glucose dehydrogenase [FAD, quinone]-like n=1 Tax=Daktulosphaira vitifoliae TaxID=58002 RepID=UPI0021AA346F|nr:glucose dehydrogenase [FAD, quinone]-like [Daktulosphaira vitifoliae]
MKMNIIVTLLISLILQVESIFTTVLDSFYGQHLQQGIPFRENTYLGNKPILKEYDFIVVGAGPGGCVIANRLSENNNFSVLLLEAGQDESVYTDMPAAAKYFQSTDYNWGYTSEPTKNGCLGRSNKRCPWPKGKGLGGSSIINNMIYTRGSKDDYDHFAALGNSGWSFEEIMPYFLKLENYTISEYQDSNLHSTKGNLHIERIQYETPLIEKFIEAGGELGLRKNIDYTVELVNGVSRVQATTKEGHRMSSAKAYIKPVKDRRNLHVAIFSRVTKLLIDSGMQKAIGVEFVKKGKTRIASAKKEVILSAGPINSPQLLMLSGIGPKEQLKKHKIPLIKDLPVGQKLEDHYGTTGLRFKINQTNISIDEQSLSDLLVFDDWYTYGKGPLTIPGGIEGLGYIKTPSGKYVELILSSLSETSDTFTIMPVLLQPDARGQVTLENKNPWHKPILNYDFYENKTDLNDSVYALKFSVKLVEETNAFKILGAKMVQIPIPECDTFRFKSDSYWECLAKYTTSSFHNQCGTCKMGDVVNNNLQVIGINGLRVVDSSIIPVIPKAHLYAPTLMIAEKAADLIKNNWSI